ncbi:glutamate-1-semialdehyde 2,1-aminomutase [Halanaerobacter jeridensis]|uniref:Glutamate-1-semialdehyde 2,1-aminomutase n=1 Tax=Halanaerobacter jeridensis TaxID=706427 RepID=A0A939BMQ1_9FIRM|nr:glutamate-1-semialdehyde 2,1-aminomutase [Halanaerobacter jeridensis]MBM7557105.1 glutamate-1-semialdehyde 2,1-aminomutase [Halanaerobacter jeridensis]
MSNSEEAFAEAKKVIPGGVNSPARAFSAVDNEPIFIEAGKGSKVYDIEDNEYLDYVGSWGPMILGYNHPQIVESLQGQVKKGTSFGAPTQVETELAELIIDAVDSIAKVRMVNSGTEATMSALRLARGYTGRDKIVKLEGCYHGHGDSLLVEAGSGVTTLGISGSSGVPNDIASETIVAPYNDLEALEKIFNKYQDEIAAVILEPVTGNMGVIEPHDEYLENLRKMTADNDILLIFDEVMTGFRLSYGGAQELYEVEPDITTLGKIIGGGLPVGAYGGKKEIMEYVAPEGPVYQAGTLSGNPLAMKAGAETLKLLKQSDVYASLEEKGAYLAEGFRNNIESLGIKAQISRVGSMFSIFFTDTEVVDYQTAQTSNTDVFAAYFNQMLKQGIYLPPSQFEANFISNAHTEDELKATIEANYLALKKVKKLE